MSERIPTPTFVSKFSAMRLVPPYRQPSHAMSGAQLLIRLALRPSGPSRELSVAPGAAAALSARERQHEDDAHSETSRKPANPRRYHAVRPTLLQIPSVTDRRACRYIASECTVMTDQDRLMARLLLIEDDKETAEEIRAELGDHGFEVDWAADGLTGLDRARAGGADAMIIDRLLPEMDGLTIIKALRYQGVRTPVLVLSALGAVDDRVRGLRAGGDDYLTKPFATTELIARIEALLRRPAVSRATMLQVGSLKLDLIERTAKRGDRVIELLPREFRLLEYMMRRKDQMLTRTMLLEDVWNYKFIPQTNLVDVHMGRLRHKVDLAHEPPMIHNVRGVGFILRAP